MTDNRNPRIIIAGMGLVSPLGLSAWETFSALLRGKSITNRLADLPANIAPVDLVQAVGSACTAQHSFFDPALELAERAAREAADEAGVELQQLPTFIATSKGAVHAFARAADLAYRGALPSFDAGLGEVRRNTNPQFDAPLAVAFGPQAYLNHH